jgi:hypothetical protein
LTTVPVEDHRATLVFAQPNVLPIVVASRWSVESPSKRERTARYRPAP